MSDAAKAVGSLSQDEKRRLLARLLQERAGRQKRYLLSFAQQRLWLLDQLEPGNAVYNVFQAVRIHGPLVVVALAGALQAIEQRHEVLRTTFEAVDGRPRQLISPQAAIQLPLIDLSDWLEPSREDEARRLIAEEVQRPFDLARGPLWRVHLIRLSASNYILLLVMHHIVSDGWSRGVLFHELAVFYEQQLTGKATGLPELVIQYVDFAVWQRQWLQGEVLERQLTYWRNQLGDGNITLALPTDSPRPPAQTFRGARQSLTISQPLTQALKNLSQQEGATLFMTLLAAFKSLLYRYTGQTDILVGSPLANRNRREIEDLIGFFVNTIVLRTDLTGRPTFRELLRRVRQVALGAYAHQDLPFERLVEELQPERDLSYQPLFQVMFVLQNTPVSRLAFSGLTLTPLQVDGRTSKFDLTLSLAASNQGLLGYFNYNTDLFEAATINRMIGHYLNLLEGIVLQPDRPLSDLPLLTDLEKQELLVEWNDTYAQFPVQMCLHQLFEIQCERVPDHIAVISEQLEEGSVDPPRLTQLTYQELNQRANQLARRLRHMGAGPEKVVGIYLDRSVEMMVAILGVLKAGAAYLPLDARLPTDRLTFMLAESDAQILLTQARLSEQLSVPGIQNVCLDADWPLLAQEATHNLSCLVQPGNLVYILFTSGSTGQPKGVAVEHRQLVNYLMGIVDRLDLELGYNYAIVSTFAADLGHTAVFPAICTGGTLHIISEMRAFDPDRLAAYFQQYPVDCLKIVPSHFAALLAAEQPEHIFPRRRLIFGGEAAGRELLRQVERWAPSDCRLINHYGPTESTVGVITYEARLPYGQANLPLGRPIANSQIYLLDGKMALTPVGVPGELYIGGTGLTRGYLNKPALTAERFVPNPFSDRRGERLYRSGDLARYLPDGDIEFLGRIDQQIKIRGFRVELGEIESALTQHALIKESGIIVREDTPGDKRLVAYLVPNNGLNLNINLLRRDLQELLPDYMIPAAFVILEALPMTANGKIDRRALPPPTAHLDRRADIVLPRDHIELQLAQIWEAVLGVHPIGVQDNFFELGGHSLLAVQLLTQINRHFNCRLPLTVLFLDGKIENLARLVRQEHPHRPATNLALLQPEGEKRPLFMAHPIGGSIFSYVNLSRALGRKQPFFAFQAHGFEDGRPPVDDLPQMAARYLAELAEVQAQGPYLLGGWSFGGVIAFEMARQLQLSGQEVGAVLLLDSRAPTLSRPADAGQAARLVHFARDLAGRYGQSLAVDEGALNDRSTEEQFEIILDQARQAQLLLPEEESQQLRQLLQLYQAHRWAIEQYHPTPADLPLVLLRAANDPIGAALPPDYGWQALTERPLIIQTIPGNHYTLLHYPHVTQLAAQIQTLL